MTRKYTIIINTYPSKQRIKELTKTFESLKSQSYKNFEVLIIENYVNKTKIINILKKYEKSLKIKLLCDPKKKLSYLFNLGWKNTSENNLAYIADDVEIDKDWLKNADSTLYSSKNIGVVTGPIISACFPSGEMHRLYLLSQSSSLMKVISKPYLSLTMENKILEPGKLFESGAYSIGAGIKESLNYPKQEIDLATTSSMVIKRKVLAEIHGFDERFTFNHADGDLFIRIKNKGYKIIFSPNVVSKHNMRLGPSRNAYFIGKDTGIFYRKNVRPKSLSGYAGAFLNLFILNTYWIYNVFRAKDPKQIFGVFGFVEGLLISKS